MNQATPPPALQASPLHTDRCPSPQPEPSVVKPSPPTSSIVSTVATKRQTTPAKDAVAGACAGAFAKTVVAPIERVKLLMQLQFSIDKRSKHNNSGATSVVSAAGQTTSPSAGTRKLGAWEVAERVYRRQGIWAFWRGNTPNVIRQGGTSALNFLLMDWYKTAISPLLVWSLRLPSNRDPEIRQKRRSIFSSFLSGGLAGGTVTTVLYPVEFVRTRLAMDIGRGTQDVPRLYPGGTRDVCLSIWRADGWRGLYQGYGIALMGVVLYRALHLGGYDAVKTEILHRRGHQMAPGDFHITNDKTRISGQNNLLSGGGSRDSKSISSSGLTMGERFLAAQIVSIFAGTACYPIDSIRRRLMMQAGLPREERLYMNSFDCFRRVIATEGFRGFYLGIGPNLLRSFGAALLLVSYDVFKIKT
eukprot:CAMPEP_0196147558 /NCGR_PEP_ID=MMETSP0910-20130528/25684_1 /TAXON_ID=49265 /ORGANISM="Thalassiosira rotula, Strain GSO102" /LENGTH=415 /DNA_ID=CAMNT_0041410005 /DNA_START=70 /DNA_END=1317 /DNA_ORIENTATION=+